MERPSARQTRRWADGPSDSTMAIAFPPSHPSEHHGHGLRRFVTALGGGGLPTGEELVSPPQVATSEKRRQVTAVQGGCAHHAIWPATTGSDDKSMIAILPITDPNSSATFKLHSQSEQGNERGSNSVTVTRPVGCAGIFGRRAIDVVARRRWKLRAKRTWGLIRRCRPRRVRAPSWADMRRGLPLQYPYPVTQECQNPITHDSET